MPLWYCCFFFFSDTASPEIYTLSLHDALPIFTWTPRRVGSSSDCGSITFAPTWCGRLWKEWCSQKTDRKSTRLNSSHRCISYAVFCLKKKKSRRQSHGRLAAQRLVDSRCLLSP